MVIFETKLPVVQDCSIRWLVNGYEAINNPELIKKVSSKNICNLPYSPHYLRLSNSVLLERRASTSHESLTSKETHWLLLEQISTDQEFYKSLKVSDRGEEEDHENNDDNSNDGVVQYDGIDSSNTIDSVIGDILRCTPAGSLAEIYADEDDELLSESDTEDRGTGVNLDMYIGHEFLTHNATRGWMDWNSK